jgi:hypothetical protein
MRPIVIESTAHRIEVCSTRQEEDVSATFDEDIHHNELFGREEVEEGGGGQISANTHIQCLSVDSEHASKTNMHTPQVATRPQELTTLSTYESNALIEGMRSIGVYMSSTESGRRIYRDLHSKHRINM